jgi:hypothetical protein
MKQVVFLDQNPGSAAMAAALFDAMVHPELAQGTWATRGGQDEVSPAVKEALNEIGFLSSLPPPVALPQTHPDKVVVVSGVEAKDGLGVQPDEWKIPPPPSPSGADVRNFRDVLRRRVWRMVAREGWYRLQPRAQAMGRVRAGRSPRAHNVVPIRAASTVAQSALCPSCGAVLNGRRDTYVHALNLGGMGSISIDEPVRCRQCVRGLAAAERQEWLPIDELAAD